MGIHSLPMANRFRGCNAAKTNNKIYLAKSKAGNILSTDNLSINNFVKQGIKIYSFIVKNIVT